MKKLLFIFTILILITAACSNKKEAKLKVIQDSIANNIGNFLKSYSPVGWSKLEKVKYELWYSDARCLAQILKPFHHLITINCQ